MSNIIVSPSGGLIEFNTGVAGGDTFFPSTAPIRLDATGGNSWITGSNVGIGTNNPSRLLQVEGSNPQIRLKSSDATDAILNIDAGTAKDSYLTFAQNGTAKWSVVNDYAGTDKLSIYNFAADAHSMTFLAGGEVGIGTVTPAYPLHVYGAGRPAVFESSNGSNITKFGNSTCGIATYNGLDINVNAANSCGLQTYGMPMTFWTSTGNGIQGAERLRIEEDGKIGIGIDSPIYGLDVYNTGIRLGGGANAWVFNNAWEGIIEFAGHDFLGVQAGAAGTVYLKGGRTLGLGMSKLDLSSMLSMVANTSPNSADLYCYGQLQWDMHSYYNEKFIINYNSGTAPSPVYSPAFVVAGRSESGYIGIGTSSPAYRLDVYGDVGGTGAGDRITLGGTPYLLSGDAASALTLQDVCDNGSTTTTSITSSTHVSGRIRYI